MASAAIRGQTETIPPCQHISYIMECIGTNIGLEHKRTFNVDHNDILVARIKGTPSRIVVLVFATLELDWNKATLR